MIRQILVLFIVTFGFVAISAQKPDEKPKAPADYVGPVVTPSGETVKKTVPRQISGGVLNGKAISLPKPAYPAVARAVGVSGAVTVQVLIDEAGTVVSAKSISGHELLRGDSELAAMQARFSPTMLEGNPVKVSGVITYNYVSPAGDPVAEKIPDDREIMWAMGMVFSITKLADPDLIRSIGDEKEFDEILKGLSEDVPEEIVELKPLFERLAKSVQHERPAIVDEIFVGLRAKVTPDEYWHIDLGNQFGSVLIELFRLKTTVGKSGFAANINSLRSELRKLDDKLLSSPTNSAPEMIEKFRKVSAFADAENLGSPTTLESLFSTVEPLFAVFDDK